MLPHQPPAGVTTCQPCLSLTLTLQQSLLLARQSTPPVHVSRSVADPGRVPYSLRSRFIRNIRPGDCNLRSRSAERRMFDRLHTCVFSAEESSPSLLTVPMV